MSDTTTIGRLPERGTDDLDVIHSILDQGLLCHAAYLTDERPVVIPTLYVRDGDRLLLHGSNTAGLVRACRQGSPLSVAVTHIDGLVVARSGFHSSANYRSVIVHGYGVLLTDQEHKRALDVVLDKLIPGRSNDIRGTNASELKQTSVIALSLDEISAKVRTGGPHDDPEDIDSEIWAGVVPMQTVYGDPIAADDVAPNLDPPDYLVNYRR